MVWFREIIDITLNIKYIYKYMKSQNTNIYQKFSDEITLEDSAEPGLFEELLEYLQAISNPARLEIILFIENSPKSVREIANHINSNYDNTKKHIEKLLNAGIIKKEAGIGSETSRGALPVWKYSLIHGGIESIIRNLNSFSNLDLRIISDKAEEAKSFLNESLFKTGMEKPYLTVLGGDDDKKVFPLKAGDTRIGRCTGDYKTEEQGGTIALAGSYLSVTRISSAHGIIKRKDRQCFFHDYGSTNGSYINHKPVLKGKAVLLSDGDIIDLGSGQTRARLVFHSDR